MEAVVSRIRKAGARVVQPIKLMTLEETMAKGEKGFDTLMGTFLLAFPREMKLILRLALPSKIMTSKPFKRNTFPITRI